MTSVRRSTCEFIVRRSDAQALTVMQCRIRNGLLHKVHLPTSVPYKRVLPCVLFHASRDPILVFILPPSAAAYTSPKWTRSFGSRARCYAHQLSGHPRYNCTFIGLLIQQRNIKNGPRCPSRSQGTTSATLLYFLV